MNKRAFIVVIIFIIMLGAGCKQQAIENDMSFIGDLTCAYFEYADEENKGIKVITSEIDQFDSLNSMILEEAESGFTGDWIYRITFNPEELMKDSQEIIVLINKESISINGNNYIHKNEPGAILNWAKSKYEYFSMGK